MFKNMEIVKYLCEFFFTNFWHWLGLLLVLEVIFSLGFVRIVNVKEKEDKNG